MGLGDARPVDERLHARERGFPGDALRETPAAGALRRFEPSELENGVTPWIEPTRPFTELVASWAADTPPGSHVTISVQAEAAGRQTAWFDLGRWSSGDASFRRTSVSGQRDDDAAVDVDVLTASREPLTAYRLRVAATGEPTLRALAAATSSGRATARDVASEPLGDAVDLAVPALSQMSHEGHFPEYGGGGASWCSPASLAMVLAFWGSGPSPDALRWVGEGHEDPQVDHAARGTYDAAYGGCGNWSFGAAYAAGFGLDAVVTRLGSLRQAELLLVAGVPLVTSIAVSPGRLPGFPLPQGTAGHLVVLRGVTAAGDPVVNDPAAPSNAEVRRVYPRAAFEHAWLRGSAGTATIVSPPGLALPEGAGAW